MAYPSDLPTVTVRHRIVGTDGTPARGGGRVTAVLTGRLWTGQGSVVPTQYTATVQEDGTYELELPPVDHPDIVAGRGEAYLVTEPAATIDTRRPGRVATEQFHVAPVTEMVGQTVDVSDVLVSKPKPGGGVERVTITGPATVESMAEIAQGDNPFTASLKDTIATEVEAAAPAAVGDALSKDETIRQTAAAAIASGTGAFVISDDPNAPLQDGQVLFVVERPWAPIDLALAWWFDATAVTGHGENAEVLQWADLSGHARHASRGDAPSAPTFTSNGINGRPSLHFNGTAHLTSAPFTPITAPITIFAVASTTAPAASNSFTDGISSAARAFLGTAAGTGWFASRGSNVFGGVPDDQPHVVTAVLWDLDFRVRVDGTTVAERYDAPIAGRTPEGVRIGARHDKGNGHQGHIGEMFMALGELTPAQIDQAESYLATKWGL